MEERASSSLPPRTTTSSGGSTRGRGTSSPTTRPVFRSGWSTTTTGCGGTRFGTTWGRESPWPTIRTTRSPRPQSPAWLPSRERRARIAKSTSTPTSRMRETPTKARSWRTPRATGRSTARFQARTSPQSPRAWSAAAPNFPRRCRCRSPTAGCCSGQASGSSCRWLIFGCLDGRGSSSVSIIGVWRLQSGA